MCKGFFVIRRIRDIMENRYGLMKENINVKGIRSIFVPFENIFSFWQRINDMSRQIISRSLFMLL